MSASKRRGVDKRSGTVVVLVAVALAVFAALAVAAISPRGGSYSGHTSQDRPVSFKVKRGYVSNAQFTLRSGICTGTFYIYDRDRVDRNGNFSITTSTNTLSGKFVTNKRVKGTARATFSGCPGGTKSVKFTARRR